MPVGEVRVRDSRDSDWVRWIANVEKEAVALARAAREADRGKHCDVMTLRRTVMSLWADHLGDHGGERRTECRAVCRRRGASATATLDNAVEHRIDDEVRNDHLL